MYLFGSRSPNCPKQPQPNSDIDVFIEDEQELTQIPPELLTTNGGPIDAFWMPVGDCACAVGDEDRKLLCWDKWGRTVHPVPITIEELLKMTVSRRSELGDTMTKPIAFKITLPDVYNVPILFIPDLVALHIILGKLIQKYQLTDEGLLREAGWIVDMAKARPLCECKED